MTPAAQHQDTSAQKPGQKQLHEAGAKAVRPRQQVQQVPICYQPCRPAQVPERWSITPIVAAQPAGAEATYQNSAHLPSAGGEQRVPLARDWQRLMCSSCTESITVRVHTCAALPQAPVAGQQGLDQVRSARVPLLVLTWRVASQLILHASPRVEQLLAHITYKAELRSAWLGGSCWHCLLKQRVPRQLVLHASPRVEQLLTHVTCSASAL